MKLLKYSAPVILSLLLLNACITCPASCPAKPAAQTATETGNLETLADYMTGFFSSLEQSLANPEYFDIHLHMVRIWPDRQPGYWLYVEQAVAGKNPYRQRVYHVSEPSPRQFVSKVYELQNPETFVDAWTDPSRFDTLTPDSLIDRTGCSIYLVRNPDGSFSGSTRDRDCLSEMRGATWASSDVRITADQLVSWDRGFDDAGNQVWGAVKGGYVFDKLENFSIEN